MKKVSRGFFYTKVEQSENTPEFMHFNAWASKVDGRGCERRSVSVR